MQVEVTHRLDFKCAVRPTIRELMNMLKLATADGFPEDTPVSITAMDDQRDGYSFAASIQRKPALEAGDE